jgi:hypothetical protein
MIQRKEEAVRTKRKVPLETCPDLDCVRSGQCRARRPEHECRKWHMTDDERRHEIAGQLQAFNKEFLAENPDYMPREMSDEDVRYEVRKALAQIGIELGVPGAASRMPPANSYTSKELQRFRQGKSPAREAETPLLDRPEGTS